MTDAHAWLEQHAPGYPDLAAEARDVITTFSLFWSLFEAQFLNNSASAANIVARSEELCTAGVVEESDFSDILAYFRDRYSDGRAVNNRFRSLNLRANDRRELVTKVLLDQESTAAEQLASCLIVVYRYRNNFFHGIKWASKFRDQYDNFAKSNQLLAYVLEISSRI